jgi:hypothetical protein
MTTKVKEQKQAAQATPVMTHAEWEAEGKKRFGEDFMKWKFVCPVCKNVAAVEDYKPFKDKGATPDSATCQCIGRFTGAKYKAFGNPRGKPCDYALFGLFRLPGVIVKFPDGKEKMSFAFAD